MQPVRETERPLTVAPPPVVAQTKLPAAQITDEKIHKQSVLDVAEIGFGGAVTGTMFALAGYAVSFAVPGVVSVLTGGSMTLGEGAAAALAVAPLAFSIVSARATNGAIDAAAPLSVAKSFENETDRQVFTRGMQKIREKLALVRDAAYFIPLTAGLAYFGYPGAAVLLAALSAAAAAVGVKASIDSLDALRKAARDGAVAAEAVANKPD